MRKDTDRGAARRAAPSTAAALRGSGPTTGPGSSQSPYLVPSQRRRAIQVDPHRRRYRRRLPMVGIPDGLGAFEDKAARSRC